MDLVTQDLTLSITGSTYGHGASAATSDGATLKRRAGNSPEFPSTPRTFARIHNSRTLPTGGLIQNSTESCHDMLGIVLVAPIKLPLSNHGRKD